MKYTLLISSFFWVISLNAAQTTADDKQDLSRAAQLLTIKSTLDQFLFPPLQKIVLSYYGTMKEEFFRTGQVVPTQCYSDLAPFIYKLAFDEGDKNLLFFISTAKINGFLSTWNLLA